MIKISTFSYHTLREALALFNEDPPLKDASIRSQVDRIFNRAVRWSKQQGHHWVAGRHFINRLDAMIYAKELQRTITDETSKQIEQTEVK